MKSHQVTENFDAENALEHGVCHVWASWKEQQKLISFSKTAISQSDSSRKLL